MVSCSLSEPPSLGLNYGMDIDDHQRLKSETQSFVKIEMLLYTLIFLIK